jgi:apolipoprotein N-acyltransferase
VTRKPRAALFWLKATLAVVAFLFAVITAVWKDWIEIVFRVDPDHHSGSLEWLIVGLALALAVACGVAARVEWRRLRLQEG